MATALPDFHIGKSGILDILRHKRPEFFRQKQNTKFGFNLLFMHFSLHLNDIVCLPIFKKLLRGIIIMPVPIGTFNF